MEKNGKVYKIINTVNEKIYVGSTQLQYLSKRMAHHRENCIKEPSCGKLYPEMIEFGIDKFKIVLLEKIIFTDKEELRAKEYEWIVKLDSVNNGYNTLYKDGKLPEASMLKTRKGLVKFYKETGDSVHKDDPIFAAYDYKNGCNTHPHNIPLQFLSELGLVGFIFLMVAIYFLIKKILFIIIKKIKGKNLSGNEYLLFFTLLGLSLNLFPLFPSGNFFNNWLSVVFYFYVGFLIYTLKKNKS
jgi:hypothetical protein